MSQAKSQAIFDCVIPLYRLRWNTRAVLEGITAHYAPRSIQVIAPALEAQSLSKLAQSWQVAPVYAHAEETFFRGGLTKQAICAALKLGESLYTPGWFYQQLLKLGAADGIDGLSEWFMVWDSDLLPVAAWPMIRQQQAIQHPFALLQHQQWGNARIVSTWAEWIRSVLAVEPVRDSVGTFVPHHMWFKQSHLESFKQQLGQYFQTNDSWQLLMMRSANQFGTFSEYWSYASWVAAQAPADLAFHPYQQYGATTERFFDDGTGLFSGALKQFQQMQFQQVQFQQVQSGPEQFSPSYAEMTAFIQAVYPPDPLPSALSFESSPRHLKKGQENMHIEELRSRWQMLKVD